MGILGLNARWSRLTKEQLELDRCVGRAALLTKRDLTRLEFLNHRIIELRALILAAPHPGAIAAMKASLQGAYLAQEGIILKWKLKSVEWLNPLFCTEVESSSLPFPNFPYERPPPDLIGAQALKEVSLLPLRLLRQSSHRRSTATVSKPLAQTHPLEKEKWHARWSKEIGTSAP